MVYMIKAVQFVLITAFAIVATPDGQQPAPPARGPSPRQIRAAADRYFVTRPRYRPGDLISRADAQVITDALQQQGLSVTDAKKILAKMLPAENGLVRLFQTERGRRFMRAVAGQRLIYDRLDRVMRASGGPATVQQLVRLPDGARYTAWKRPRAVPGLVDFLPKTGSGKTRKIKDYDKPTGRIYTQAQLQKQLERIVAPR